FPPSVLIRAPELIQSPLYFSGVSPAPSQAPTACRVSMQDDQQRQSYKKHAQRNQKMTVRERGFHPRRKTILHAVDSRMPQPRLRKRAGKQPTILFSPTAHHPLPLERSEIENRRCF